MTAPDERQQRNLRTAVILLSIALAFFLGIVAKYWWIGK